MPNRKDFRWPIHDLLKIIEKAITESTTNDYTQPSSQNKLHNFVVFK